MDNITLNKIVVSENQVDYYFSVSEGLRKYFTNELHFFLEFNYDLTGIPTSILTIPFVSNIIPLIWITNSKLIVEKIDSSFFEALDKIKDAYQKMYPNIQFRGLIEVWKTESNTYIPEIDAASLFSGGLDALTTYIRIREKTPLLITEYGWHKDKVEKSIVWEADKENALQFANKKELKNIFIQSNYGTFIIAKNIDNDFGNELGDTWWHGLHHGLAIITAAIPIAFKLKVKGIYIASSNSPQYLVTCASDPTIDNEIKFASGRVFHDGYELTRQDKVKTVVDYYSSVNEITNIRVCFKNEQNCCKCEKCLRTIFGIIAEGEDPRNFGFDIPENLTEYVIQAINEEVKYFTNTFINMYWEVIKKRMKENQQNIIFQDLLDWFLSYDFYAQKRKALLKYRIKNFFPILKRKIRNKYGKIIAENS